MQFVDGDCWVESEWWEAAIQELISNPSVVVVCGRRRK
ncbi:hypothetical protein RintRC_7448 [Richelia intracellularis]|nr:hypothetical protein RintRC_7448 [Richelia intracellularis]